MSGIFDTRYGTAKAVTPSDTVDQQYTGLYISAAGNVTVTMESGDTPILFTAPPVGTILPIRVKRVLAATTATVIGLN
jgi:hypothetical protein